VSDSPHIASESPAAPAAPAGRRRLTNGHLWILALVCAFYLLLSHIPLRSSDLWIHETYGQWILDNGRLPIEDPVLELAAGMRVVDRDWGSQVLFAWLYRAGGAEALSVLFALTLAGAYLALGRAYFLQAGALAPAVGAAAAALVVAFSRLATIRPENLGLLCFALLLWALVSARAIERCGDCPTPARWPRWIWGVVPLLMVLWTNFHGSFPIGVMVLAGSAAGRLLDVAGERRSVRAALEDPEGRRRLWLAELGFAATLVNPYGMRIWLEVASFASNPNLADIVEWRQMLIFGPGGREFVASVLVLLLLLRHVRRRLPASHGLLLTGAAFGALSGVRFLTWYGPLFALAIAPLTGDLWRRWTVGGSERRVGRRLTARVRWTLAAVMVWIAFALSPQGNLLLAGEPRTPVQLYGAQTPLGATAYLRSRRPAGLVWAPQWWSDWLVRMGPPGLRPMVTSNIHLVPHRVWLDYMRVQEGHAGWAVVLDRYRIDVVVLDLVSQRMQAFALRSDPGWSLAFEDAQALVFLRRTEAPAVLATSPEDSAKAGAQHLEVAE
jgi:hypothetical protein